MRITRRTSGGRGEYEISENTPAGITPTDILRRRIVLEIEPAWQIDAGLELRPQGGKRRIRMTEAQIHVHRQIAAALLLPETVRADDALGSGEPVVQKDRYAIEHIYLGEAGLSTPGAVVLPVQEVIARNKMVEAEEIGLSRRLTQLHYVWDHASNFPAQIAELLKLHRGYAQSGAPIPEAAEKLVATLQAVVSDNSEDLKIDYTQQLDVLPALVAALQVEVPQPPIRVDDIDPEQIEVKRRTVKEWKRWANARGPESARFRRKVREAYKSTCVLCGSCFPSLPGVDAGVDAAHILPWSDYDLDRVSNGLCLCKTHHWAFDQAIFYIAYENGQYVAKLTDGIEEKLLQANPGFSIGPIKQLMGPLSSDRLPANRPDWPTPELLERLNTSQRPVG